MEISMPKWSRELRTVLEEKHENLKRSVTRLEHLNPAQQSKNRENFSS